MSLALLSLYGATLPWVTIRGFDDEVNTFNLTDIRGGVGIIVTIVVWMLVGVLVAIFRSLAGRTVLSLSAAVLGWMAGITGILLGTVGSLIPSIELAGIDLTRASIAQGLGVTVTVVSSLSLAFLVVRQYPPLSTFTPRSRIAILPLCAAVPLILVAANMHAPWIVLGGTETGYRAYLAGDSLFGSGLVVIALWMCLGLWLTALVLPRNITMRVAGGVSVLVAMILVMYAMFMWVGGRLLSWLIPSSVEDWTAISVEPMLFVVLVSAVGLGAMGILSFFPRFTDDRVNVDAERSLGGARVNTSDAVAVLVLIGVAGSVLYRVLT
jgi:hypothetical protein